MSATSNERGTIELVEAILDDTRSLVGAQVETLRADMGERFSALGSALTSTLLAFSIMIVTALLVGFALAETIIAAGVPTWAAFWIVSLGTAALGYGLVQRARRIAGAATSSAPLPPESTVVRS